MDESRKNLSEADRRKERLAAALRENLKRRKAQSRERRVSQGPQEDAPPSEPEP